MLRAPLILALCTVARCSDPTKPHEHQGTLEPFKLGAPPPLTSSEQSQLAAGKSVQKTTELADGKGARAVAVFDVAAPPTTVWECILDLKNYPRMVPGVAAMDLYNGPSTSGGVTTTRAQWTLAVLGYRLSYYLETRHNPSLNSMTFRLDYSRNSDIDDTVGYWHVAPLRRANGELHSRVTYSAALTLKGWFPKPVVDILFATTIGRATGWVAVEAGKRIAAGAGGASGPSCKWSWRYMKRVCTPPPPPPPPPPPGRSEAGYFAAVFLALVCLVSTVVYF